MLKMVMVFQWRVIMVDRDDDPIPHLNPMVPEPHVQQDLDEQDVRTSAATFVAKMKASSSTVQSTVDNVVTEASRLFSDVVGKLKSKTDLLLQSKSIGEEDIERENLLRVFDQLQNPFAQLETSHQQQKYFTQSGYFIKPR